MPFKGLIIEDLLNPTGDDAVIQVFCSKMLVATVSVGEAPEEEKNNCESGSELYPFLSEQLHVPSLIKKITASYAVDNSGFWKLVRAMQCVIRQKVRGGTTQCTNDMFFNYRFSALTLIDQFGTGIPVTCGTPGFLRKRSSYQESTVITKLPNIVIAYFQSNFINNC